MRAKYRGKLAWSSLVEQLEVTVSRTRSQLNSLDPSKAWIGKENPCNEEDMDLFYAATVITIGDGRIANFWHSPWLHGLKPKSVAPSTFSLSTRKNFTVNKRLVDEFWITNINLAEGITTQHITEFVTLWTNVSQFHLVEGTTDAITWKFTTSDIYTAASTYQAQFEGLTRSTMLELVWKNWAPPKCKLFCLACPPKPGVDVSWWCHGRCHRMA